MTSKIQTLRPFAGRSKIQEILMGLGLFLLALLPRAYDLPRFVTADEAKWVYRSAQFLAALLRGDFPATSVNLTPAVTTTWLGSLGLAGYYQLNQAAIQQPFATWLTSLPQFRVDLAVLVATRWPMVILTSLGIATCFLLVSRLFNPTLAFLAAIFMALDPHPIALSRIIGHDAPVALFMALSLLLLLLAVRRAGEQRSGEAERSDADPLRVSALLPIILSAIAAGLAFLSKAPALFLIPFTGLVLVVSMRRSAFSLKHFIWVGLVWLAVAYFTFILFWPAAWVDPLGRPVAVFENAFLSATDEEEAGEEGYWQVPDLGPFYYLVNGGFKLSPLVMVGAGLGIFFWVKQRGRESENQTSNLTIGSTLFWLIAFVLLFTLFMTASDKRSARYILPIFPPLAIIAAYGWLELSQVAGSRVAGSRAASSKVADSRVAGSKVVNDNLSYASRFTLHSSLLTCLLLATLLSLLPYTPYYFTYFNPLLGGPFTASRLVKIGWGEGLDQIGRFLQREGSLRGSRVGTSYASTVAPFFEGDLSGLTEPDLDYLVLYLKQIQSGEPSPTFIRYFQQMAPLFSVDLNGLHYADVYPGPTLQSLTPDPQPPTSIPFPIAFRPLTLYGSIGQALDVDVVWQAAEPLPIAPAIVSLTTLSPPEDIEPIRQIPVLAQAEAPLTPLASDIVVSRHHLLLPADLTPGPYTLWLDEHLLGKIELRNFEVPATLNQVRDFVFDGQIGLAGYQFEPTTDYLGVTIAWQAQMGHLPDYTVFVQILNAETNERLAGVDTPPLKGQWPTSRWVKGEIVTDEYLVAIPPDFQPGYYKVIVGLYQPETGQRLTLADGQDYWTLPWTFIRK